MLSEVVKIARYKIEHDLDGCIGCGACTAISDNWELKDVKGEEKALPRKAFFDSEDDLAANKEAAESCPVEVIHILDTRTGKKVI